MSREPILVGRYRVGPLLGAGYYAEVFRVQELRTRAFWAGKVYPAHAASKAAARHEIEAFEALSHPRMPSMHEAFEESGRTWIIMDLVAGPSLRNDVEAGGPLDAFSALRMGADVCDLLGYVGYQGWTYRDLHPRNIHHLTPTGVVVLDFDGARPPPGCRGGGRSRRLSRAGSRRRRARPSRLSRLLSRRLRPLRTYWGRSASGARCVPRPRK
jgi:serine/threonine protein kinase